ncbi:MAG: NAD-dependent epimerase/dehydratase family protein [Candidatus Riflebacteria bacterium]|nr:NAD-dependent epimerase/dehydratase family protein [Candidatus Riflebacteria bacterium]
MKILVLGGTVFLGRHIVASALAQGYSVTLFNRGRQNPNLFPEVEKLRGDRDGDLSALRGRSFDGVVDTSTYTPEQARRVVEILDRRIGHYTFISSVSAYARFPAGHSYNETSLLIEGNDGYGALKARSEEVFDAAFPGRVTNVRPGLIAGPHDPTGRFSYWPRRIARGGDVLAPGRPERAIQFIDARDVADWCIRLSEGGHIGNFNAIGPQSVLTMQKFLEACRSAVESNARFNWVSDNDLIAGGAKAWTELPLWIPENDKDFGGFLLGDNRKATTAGLTYRPLLDTIKETLEWDLRDGESADLSKRVVPISQEKEDLILADQRKRLGEKSKNH